MRLAIGDPVSVKLNDGSERQGEIVRFIERKQWDAVRSRYRRSSAVVVGFPGGRVAVFPPNEVVRNG